MNVYSLRMASIEDADDSFHFASDAMYTLSRIVLAHARRTKTDGDDGGDDDADDADNAEDNAGGTLSPKILTAGMCQLLHVTLSTIICQFCSRDIP